MILWILAIIYVEALTELIIESTILSRIRNFFARISDLLGELFSCGYCMSVWVSATVSWCLPGDVIAHAYGGILPIVFDFIIKTLVVHRLSNVWHEIASKFFRRAPFNIVVHSVGGDDGTSEPEEE